MSLEPCPSCRRHVRSDAARCPFCSARRRSAHVARALLAAPALALAMLPSVAHAGDAMVDGDAMRDAQTDAADGELDAEPLRDPERDREWERQVQPLYGVPPPPGCRSGCAVGATRETASSALTVLPLGALAARRRRRIKRKE